MQNDLLSSFFGRKFSRIDDYFSFLRRLVWIRDSRELLDDAGSRLRIKSLAVTLLAGFERRGDMHQDKASQRLNHLAHRLTNGFVGSDGGADGDAAILRDLRSDVADAADIDVAMLLRKAEFRREMLADQVAVENGHGTAAGFEELGQQHVGDGRFAGARKSGEEDRHALLVPRRIAAAQLLHDFGIREPGRDIAALVQTLPQFGAGNVEHARALRDLVVRNVFVLILEVDHHVERDHGHADVGFVLLEELLGVVRTVEGLAVGVVARSGMVAADDEMRAAVVLADDAVPDRLARSAHAHGKGKHGQLHRCLRILREQQLVATHAREVIHVARLGHANGRMKKQVRFDLLGRAESELLVGPMHGIAGLERNHATPAEARKFSAQFCRRQA